MLNVMNFIGNSTQFDKSQKKRASPTRILPELKHDSGKIEKSSESIINDHEISK